MTDKTRPVDLTPAEIRIIRTALEYEHAIFIDGEDDTLVSSEIDAVELHDLLLRFDNLAVDIIQG